MTTTETRTCSRCRITKPITEFYVSEQVYSGARADCIACNRELKAVQRNDKRERMRQQMRDAPLSAKVCCQCRINHLPEGWTRKICPSCCNVNIQKAIATKKIKAGLQPAIKTCTFCHQEKPLEEFYKVAGGFYYDSRCKQCTRKRMDTFRKKTGYRPNQRARADNLKVKMDVLSHYGKDGNIACVRCGFTDIRALSIDHINGGGYRERKFEHLASGGPMYRRLQKNNYPAGYQTLCMNCQWLKRTENHELDRVPLWVNPETVQ